MRDAHPDDNIPRPLRDDAGHALHGGDVWAAARSAGRDPGDLLDLSTNTFAAMGAHTLRLLAGAPAPEYLRYPDPRAGRLRDALARAEGVEPERLLPGNGASELIWAALTALRPAKVLLVGPLFTEYARAAAALGIARDILTPPETPAPSPAGGVAHGPFAPDAATLARIKASDADMLIVCSPNNPGAAILADPDALLRAARGRTLLLDASYKDFLWRDDDPAPWAAHSAARLGPPAAAHGVDLLLLGSLTKFYCCPGLRLGFVAAAPETIGRIAAARPPWLIPAGAEHAGIALLARRDDYRAALPALRRDVDSLAARLRQSGLFRAVYPGVSFVCAALNAPDEAPRLRDRLLNRNILIRLCDNIPGMPPGFVRIQARPESEMTRLYEALTSIARA